MAFITLDRKIFDHFLWTERRPKTRFEAWIDLIQLVSFKSKNELIINNTLVKWGRGQYPISYSFLANRWIWSTQKVRGYLTMLKNNKQIVTETTGQITILTLCNYDQYNPQQQGERQGKRQGGRQPDGKVVTGIKESKQSKQGKQVKPVGLKKPTDYIDRIIDCFVEEHGNYQVVSKGKERAAAGKIAVIYKNKYPQATTDEAIEGLRIYFKQCLNINDNWLRNNMSLSIIISKFNEINKILQNGNRKPGTGATPEQIAGAVANHFKIDPTRGSKTPGPD